MVQVRHLYFIYPRILLYIPKFSLYVPYPMLSQKCKEEKMQQISMLSRSLVEQIILLFILYRYIPSCM